MPVTATYDASRGSVPADVAVPERARAAEGAMIEGPDGQPIVGEGPRTTESGLGDIVAAATVFDVLRSSTGDVALDVTGKVKFGTADEDKGLGDRRAGLHAAGRPVPVLRSVHGDRHGGLHVARGDPEGVNLNDAFFASLGGTYAVSSTVRCRRLLRFPRSVVSRQRRHARGARSLPPSAWRTRGDCRATCWPVSPTVRRNGVSA